MQFAQEGPYNLGRNALFHGLPALAHDNPYLQSLRENFKDVDSSTEGISIHDGNQEIKAQNYHSPGIENTLQHLLKEWHQDWSENMKDQTLRFPLNQAKGDPPDPITKLWCNQCSESIDYTRVYFVCRICQVRNHFNLCENCAARGARCYNPNHELQLVKSTEVAFNIPVKVLAKDIHSIPRDLKDGLIPSVDILNMPDTSLHTVMQAYAQQPIKSSAPNAEVGSTK